MHGIISIPGAMSYDKLRLVVAVACNNKIRTTLINFVSIIYAITQKQGTFQQMRTYEVTILMTRLTIKASDKTVHLHNLIRACTAPTHQL